MDGVRRFLGGFWLLIVCCFLVACSESAGQSSLASDTLRYQVSFIDSSQQRLRIEMDLPLSTPGQAVTLYGGVAGEYDLLSLHAITPTGQAYKLHQDGRYSYLEAPAGARNDRVRVIYEMRIGGLGRHGHQGNFDDRFAAFDGRLYLVPKEQAHIREILVRFDTTDLPDHYRIISPWQLTATPNQYRVTDYGQPQLLFKSLQKSLGVVGPFELHTEQVGDTRVELYTYAGWQADEQQMLVDTSLKLFRYFNQQFDYEVIGGPYQIVWHPRAKDGRKIWTAVWSNGMAYEMVPGNAAAMQRNWELFGHRVAHPINEYAPWGMRFSHPDEHWFLEGWASYIELEAGQQSGVFDATVRWERLYQRYLEGISREGLTLDFPLAQERQINDPDVKEFIHYTKAPLVTRLLANLIRVESGEEKSLEGFMAEIYARHRGFQGSVPLRDALEAYSGLDLGDFWTKYVKTEAMILPLWRAPKTEEVVTPGAVMNDLVGLACSLNMSATDDTLLDLAYVQHVLQRMKASQQDAYLNELPMSLRARFFRDRLTQFTHTRVYPALIPDTALPEPVQMLQTQLQGFQDQAETSLDREYLKGFRLGVKTGKGLAVGRVRSLFVGGEGRMALNLYWEKQGHQVQYRVLKQGQVVYEKSRPVKTGWATTLTFFNLDPTGRNGGIYAGPGEYQLEVWLLGSESRRLARLPFRLLPPGLTETALADTANERQVLHYLVTSDEVQQPGVREAYRVLQAAQQVMPDLDIARLHQPQIRQRVDQSLWRQWAGDNLDMTHLKPLQDQLRSVLAELALNAPYINQVHLAGAQLTSEAFQDQPCDQVILPKARRIRLVLDYAQGLTRELNLQLLNAKGDVVWHKQRHSLASYGSYWVDVGPLPEVAEGRYELVVEDVGANPELLLKRALWLY